MEELGIILILGKEGCSACKKALKFFSKEYSNYFIFYTENLSDLPANIRRRNAQLIRQTENDITYPMIFMGDKIHYGFNPKYWVE